jgi:putative oxidoreductase
MTKLTQQRFGFVLGQNGRTFDRNVDTGLLFTRLGLGGMMIFFGLPKVLGGPEKWEEVGSAMGNLGITFAPQFWGLSAGLSEALGGLFLALGLFFRPAAATMVFTMVVAAITMIKSDQGFFGATHAIDMGIVLFGLMITGPGLISLDRKLFAKSIVSR